MTNPKRFILTIAATLLLAIGFHPGLQESLSFDPTSEPNLLTVFACHWVHWNTSHLFWSGGTFLVFLLCWPGEWMKRFWLCLALATVAIPIGLGLANASISSYAGMSGIDSGLFVLFVWIFIRERAKEGDRKSVWVGGLGLALFGLKIGYEAVTGLTLFSNSGNDFVGVPLAHLLGGLAGWVCALPTKETETALIELSSLGEDTPERESV